MYGEFSICRRCHRPFLFAVLVLMHWTDRNLFLEGLWKVWGICLGYVWGGFDDMFERLLEDVERYLNMFREGF